MDKIEQRVREILEALGAKQFRAVVKAVDKKGLMHTDWSDIDNEGGSLDFNVIAKAIATYIRSAVPEEKQIVSVNMDYHGDHTYEGEEWNQCRTQILKNLEGDN